MQGTKQKLLSLAKFGFLSLLRKSVYSFFFELICSALPFRAPRKKYVNFGRMSAFFLHFVSPFGSGLQTIFVYGGDSLFFSISIAPSSSSLLGISKRNFLYHIIFTYHHHTCVCISFCTHEQYHYRRGISTGWQIAHMGCTTTWIWSVSVLFSLIYALGLS